jgi:predicted transcriptional regulator
MESLFDLLFELSNEDRLKILLELEKAPLNLSSIAKKLDFTAQGTSRNVARLVQIKLIERNPDGEYLLTSYGENALKLLASYEFLSSEREYILTHSTRWLPQTFISRLGELNKNVKVTEILDVVGNVARERRASAEYEWFITPGRLSSPRDAVDVVNALKRGVKIRAIESLYYVPSEEVMRETPREILAFFEEEWRKGNLQARYLNEVKIRLYMTEKAVSILALPKKEGEVDVLGYCSRDPAFHRWCGDLFEYYWANSKQLPWFWTQGRPSVNSR